MEDETQTQTQPQQKQLMTDIFGSDDEDDNNVAPQKTAPTAASARFDDSDDDIFAGSDDDNEKSRAPSSARNNAATKVSALDENLMDSDDDAVVVPVKGGIRRKRTKAPAAPTGGKLKKRKVVAKPTSRDSDGGGGSGGEYDSGEEIQETKADRGFIDNDDDYADIVKEYEEDNTDFNDEAPDEDFRGGKKSKKGSSASGNGSHLSSGINLKDQDPLSQTLAAMKNPKAAGLTDQQKDIMVDKLQAQMNKAVQMDNECYAKQQPAVYKMQLLATVQTTISMKPLHQTLLDKDILSNLRDWIEPRDANTLPALSVRTTVYELLLQLPCLPDHLKRTNGEKPPIGVIIVALRKHKMETSANKRLLKELMDKWSRPIFSKSADVRVGSGAGALPTTEHHEIQEAIKQRYLAQRNANAGTHNHHQSQTQHGEEGSRGGGSAGGSGSQRNVGFGAVLGGASSAGSSSEGHEDGEPKKAPDLYTRARAPYNTGFLFTVQPELKNIDKRNVMERNLGEGRMKLFKKMSEGGLGGNKALGKKANPRAMDMSVSQGPKH